MLGLVGKKIGMTRIFSKDGISIPITVIEVKNHRITQIRSLKKNDKYIAIQLTTGKKKRSHLNKSEIGHFSKAAVIPGIGLWEFKIDKNHNFTVGAEIELKSVFKNVHMVNVIGTSKGKGFSGTVKRWNFRTQDATHGNSLSHRVPGSIGQNQTPGKVFKGKKMSGHLGNRQVTIQNLKIIQLDIKNDLILLKGSVPGAVNSIVTIKPSINKGV